MAGIKLEEMETRAGFMRGKEQGAGELPFFGH
jgi:hypothetical protein